MRSRYRINDPDAAHFVAATVVQWLPVFTTRAHCDILVRSLAHCREHKGLKVYGRVIMGNHFHAILAGPALAQTIADLKKFAARAVIAQLEQEGRDWLLNQLQYYRATHKQASTDQVWQEGVHPQAIGRDEMMLQKLEYLHHNPVKRGLVAAPEHWRYSSARAWLPGALAVLRCDDWRQPG